MIYQKWHNDTEAKALEDSLVEALMAGLKLTPVVREKHYESVFEQLRGVIGDKQQGDEVIIHTNINPYRALFQQGEFKALLRLQKDSLPLSGDGYVQTGAMKRPKNQKYYLNNRHLPTLAHSICHFKHDNLMLKIPAIRELDTFSKCYNDSFYSSSYAKEADFLTESVKSILRDPLFPLNNLPTWIGRVINEDDVMDMLMDKAGIKTNLETWGINDIEQSRPYVELIIKMLSLSNCQHAAFYKLMKIEGDMTETQAYFPRLANAIKYQWERINEYYPDLSKNLLGNILSLASQCNFFWEGNAALQEALSKTFMDIDVAAHTHHSKAEKLMDYLDKPELVAAMNKKSKREKLQNDLGL